MLSEEKGMGGGGHIDYWLDKDNHSFLKIFIAGRGDLKWDEK